MRRHLGYLHKVFYIFEKRMKIYASVPNFKSTSFEMSYRKRVEASPLPNVCYSNDTMWKRVKERISFLVFYLRLGSADKFSADMT